MIEFAALPSITAPSPAVDPAFATGAGTAVFGDILAESLDLPSVAAPPPSPAAALEPANRPHETGKFLPEIGLALPGDPTVFADGRDEKKLTHLADGPPWRAPVRPAAPNRAARVSGDSMPEAAAAIGDASSTTAPATAGADQDAAGEVTAPTDPLGEPPIAVAALALFPPAPASPEAAQAIPRPSQASPRLPAVPTAAIALPFGLAPMEARLPRPAETGGPIASAPQQPVEGAVARPMVIPAALAPIDLALWLPLSAAQISAPAPIATAGPGLRPTPSGTRAKALGSTEPAQSASPIVASVAVRTFDEPAPLAPLSVAAPGFALAVPSHGGVAPAAATLAPTAPGSRHEFVALVERLIDGRNALSPQPVHTALAHTEFGEISLRFAHDERGLSVAMASTDPDFAPAVQAALLPERGERATLDQPRGQPGPGQHHGAGEDRGANHAAPQPRPAQERDSRFAAAPKPSSDEHDRPSKRTGIFA